MFDQPFTITIFAKRSVRHVETSGSTHFKVPIRLMKLREDWKIGLQKSVVSIRRTDHFAKMVVVEG